MGNVWQADAAAAAGLYRSLFEAGPQPVLIVERERLRVVRANEAAARLYGYAAAELADIELAALWPAAAEALAQAPATPLQRHRHRDGRDIEACVEVRELSFAAREVLAIYVAEASASRFAAALLEAQARLLGAVAAGTPLAAVLDALLREVGALLAGVRLAVLVNRDDGGVERHGEPLAEAAASLPIRSSAGTILGTLVAAYPEPAAPPPRAQSVLDMALQLAALAIEADRASRALIESEARMWAFMDHAFALLSIKDRDGRYVLVNRRFESSTGIPAAVAQGRSDAQLFPRALAQAYSAHDEEVLRSLKGIEFEEQVRQRDGMHTYLAAKFPLLHPGGEAYGTGAILLDVTERKIGGQGFERGRDEERARLSRELHDELGQRLASLAMRHTLLARTLRERLPEAQWAAHEADALHAETAGALDAVRRICLELRPEILERLGIAGALRWQAEEFSRRSGLACRLALPAAPVALGDEASLFLFRTLQEALSNVAQHSAATEVEVTLRRDGDQLELAIDDNGRGMAAEAPASLGLLGMRERAAAAGGSVAVGRSPTGGTRVAVRISAP